MIKRIRRHYRSAKRRLSWSRLEWGAPNSQDGKAVVSARFYVRRWHPGFWLFLFRMAWRGLTVKPSVFKPFAALWLTRYAVKNWGKV